jgi:hypothetical protein
MNNLLPSLIYDVPFIVEHVVYLAPRIDHAALPISCTALGSGGDWRGRRASEHKQELTYGLLIERYLNSP